MPAKQKKAEKSCIDEENTTNSSESPTGASHASNKANSTDATNSDILEAIANLNSSFDQKFDVLSSTLSEVKVSLVNISARVTEAEEVTKVHETRIELLEKRCANLEAECGKLREKTCDLESRSRRQNIRIYGIKEGVEKGKPTEFVTKLLMQVLSEGNFESPVIDRAHRSPQPSRDERPRAFIVRVHHYQVKESILRLARSKPLQYDGTTIHIFPDLATDVMKQRQKFDSIRKKCREHEVRCGFRFPSKFIVTVKGNETKVFDSPEMAESYLRQTVDNW